MNEQKFKEICKNTIKKYLKKRTNEEKFDIFNVWCNNSMQYYKALFGTTIGDTRYYEFTYDENKKELSATIYIKEKDISEEIK